MSRRDEEVLREAEMIRYDRKFGRNYHNGTICPYCKNKVGEHYGLECPGNENPDANLIEQIKQKFLDRFFFTDSDNFEGIAEGRYIDCVTLYINAVKDFFDEQAILDAQLPKG